MFTRLQKLAEFEWFENLSKSAKSDLYCTRNFRFAQDCSAELQIRTHWFHDVLWKLAKAGLTQWVILVVLAM